MSNVSVFIQVQVVTIVSVPLLTKRSSGSRLTRNASFTAVFTWARAQWGGLGLGVMVVRMGVISSVITIIRLEDIITGTMCIATTWSCTKSFWFLRPVDDCYPLGAGE